MYKPQPNDLTIQELVNNIISLALENGASCYIKWTCPRCGERAAANERVTVSRDGAVVLHQWYVHTEKDDGSLCSQAVNTLGYRFGAALVYGL